MLCAVINNIYLCHICAKGCFDQVRNCPKFDILIKIALFYRIWKEIDQPLLPIRRRSYVIIGFVAPAIGPNKSIETHTAYISRQLQYTRQRFFPTSKRIIHGFIITMFFYEWACRWEGESVNHGRGNCYARRLRSYQTHYTLSWQSILTWIAPQAHLLAWMQSWQIRMLWRNRCIHNSNFQRVAIRTLPYNQCDAGDVSRVSFCGFV